MKCETLPKWIVNHRWTYNIIGNVEECVQIYYDNRSHEITNDQQMCLNLFLFYELGPDWDLLFLKV